MGQLDGKTALITGGTSGIGLASAQRLAAEGATVFVTGRDQAKLDAAAAGGLVAIRGDVSDPADLDRVFAAIAERGNGLDVLFTNAGGGGFATLEDTTWEHYEQTFHRNVAGTIFTVQKALPLLNQGAAIVLAGSTAAAGGTPAFGMYAASKAAVRSFGRTWAAELVGRGIRVNTIVPGPTETPGLAGLAADPSQVQAVFKSLSENVPMNRLGRPEEIAAAVLFLASGQSSFMTGAELYVDGGERQV
ncbi:oxidoreductase [Actinoplanes cyaneus]|uniref:Oxidoreductase n=1 Tax=Actinoplanes cyaneus TaxID=52696 RepID=A0A919IGS6_9ACTN|nr:SDR family oxidoreductase [Actinoplanes cyaneus]MCW2140100.1 NAD(P)-dependent dehydrogenase, short-chain alcohol dehydrogenase family [Actinoplanes cyaneus]GID65414.1 oxidoreductase [Actinoplanes cyaneus]